MYKIKISNYINTLLRLNNWTQKDLADLLKIKQGRLSAYATGRELPGLEIIMELAAIGGLTIDELLTTDTAPQKTNNISILIKGNNVSHAGKGHIYINTSIKQTHDYIPQPGDITETQAARLKELVDTIADLEKSKQRPRTHSAIWSALKRKFKVTYYREIKEEDFLAAEAYLLQWCGRLKRSLRTSDIDQWRKERYKAIFSSLRNQFKWNKSQIDAYVEATFGEKSLSNLTDKQIEYLYNKIMQAKKK